MTKTTHTGAMDRKTIRRNAIINAAFNLFHEQGYNNVSMTDIIKRSGGSLATAYELFENKSGLLRAIVTERCASDASLIDQITTMPGTPEDALRKIGHGFLEIMLDAENVGLMRIIMSESMRDPAFGEYLNASVPQMAVSALGNIFARWDEEELLNVDDPTQAAESFFALLLHHQHLRALCGLPVTMTQMQKDRHVEHVVKMINMRYRW